MTDTKHTPGPLVVHETDDTCLRLVSEDYGGIAVLHDPLVHELGREAEWRANAARLALAWNTHDELARACREMYDELDPDVERVDDAAERWRVAILNAKQEEEPKPLVRLCLCAGPVEDGTGRCLDCHKPKR